MRSVGESLGTEYQSTWGRPDIFMYFWKGVEQWCSGIFVFEVVSYLNRDGTFVMDFINKIVNLVVVY